MDSYIQTDHQPQLSYTIFLLWNEAHWIMGYQRQRGIHQIMIFQYVSCCLPACSGSIFQLSDTAIVLVVMIYHWLDARWCYWVIFANQCYRITCFCRPQPEPGHKLAL